jgi:two-component system, chemotaxis family, sensor kinase Cph1
MAFTLRSTPDLAQLSHPPVVPSQTLQPHGVLFCLSQPELTILQVSDNSDTHLGIPATTLIGQTWSQLTGLESPQTTCVSIDTPKGRQSFELVWHESEQGWIVELEPTPAQVPVGTEPATLLGDVGDAMTRLQATVDVETFLNQAALEVQHLFGCSRAHLLRFDQAGAGEVVAEARTEALPSYLGLHFPATDIPEPVRHSYQRGMVRYVPNVAVPPVALHPDCQEPLDLSLVTLRGVDPCCVTYHQNMGVLAFLAMPLVVNQQLWGLISCHHHQPLVVPPSVRATAWVLAQFVAAELANRLQQQELQARSQLQGLQANLMADIAQATDFGAALIKPQPRLLNLVNAQGAAVCLGTEITLVGATPTPIQVLDLLTWVTPQIQAGLYVTDCLPLLYPDAENFHTVGSGVLVLQISQLRQYYLLWFRPEVQQTISWAGNPDDNLKLDDQGEVSLGPRNSFALWQETVHLTSLPWQTAEQQSALDVRNAIVGIVLTKADELGQINRELEQKNRELESFAFAASHDLQEPLRGIHNYAALLLKTSSQHLDEQGRSRLQTMLRLTGRMEDLIEALLRFSRLGQAPLKQQPVDLNLLLERVVEVVSLSRPDQPPQLTIPQPLPMVRGDSVLLAEVLTNLLSNACKYTDHPPAQIEIGYHPPTDLSPTGSPQTGPMVFYVKDQGIGIRPRHLERIFQLFKRLHEQDLYGGGTGVGLTITRKIIERHGGTIWVESTFGEGTTFFFTLGGN